MDVYTPLIIFGSSRSDGNTRCAVQSVFEDKEHILVDLTTLQLTPYDYESRNQDDDFIALAEKMVKHEHIVLATPVYWYTMSAVMKTFLDRWSDLVRVRKDLGKALAGKWLYVVTSYATDPPMGFEDAFRQSCAYMKMHYGGCYYHYSGENENRRAENSRFAASFGRLFEPGNER